MFTQLTLLETTDSMRVEKSLVLVFEYPTFITLHSVSTQDFTNRRIKFYLQGIPVLNLYFPAGPLRSGIPNEVLRDGRDGPKEELKAHEKCFLGAVV